MTNAKTPDGKLSKAQTKLIKPTDVSARKPKRPMLDEDDDEVIDTRASRDFTNLFDDPEKY